MFRVVTVAREYGSGGGRIALLLADRLGWKLLDRCLVEKIAETARIDPQVVEKFDERLDPWFYRLAEAFWRSPGLRGYIGGPLPNFDAEVAADLTRGIIEEAAVIGDCVIVAEACPQPQHAALQGRGGEETECGGCHPRHLRPRSLWRRLEESPSVPLNDFLVPGGERGG
jgi:hypothetical protein